MTILKETDSYVIREIFGRKLKDKKFLCVGGPDHGLMRAEFQVDFKMYSRFNRAQGRGNYNDPSCILVAIPSQDDPKENLK